MYEDFIYKSRYARWLDNEQRRENWDETVDRYVDYMVNHLKAKHGYDVPEDVRTDVRAGIYNKEVMPSMRALMTAGAALERSPMAGFNCSFMAVDDPLAFSEAMLILLNGTGVGFSVERQSTDLLPVISSSFERTGSVIEVADSKEGWVEAFALLVKRLYRGEISHWDVSKVRPKGARLKTFGGRASGPEPLVRLFQFTIELFQHARGRKLEPIECHDLMCMIADIVVVGGVRRSALISLSDLTDPFMAGAKSDIPVLAQGKDWIKVQYTQHSTREISVKLSEFDLEQIKDKGTVGWWVPFGHRSLANNSAVYDHTPSPVTFMTEWTALVASQSGERGIFNRQAAEAKVRATGRREGGWLWGVNPCSEIILRSMGVCNLSEVIVRGEDSFDTIKRKIRLATILGTWQSTLIDFKGLRPQWKKNAEEERLLGVSMTGVMDHLFLKKGEKEWLEGLKAYAVEVNAKLADELGINRSAAITCSKPSGTVSQLTNTASGIHSRYAPFYIRTVRGDVKDPLTQLMIDEGVPHEPCVMRPDTTVVFSFPVKAPEGATTRHDRTAIQELESWKRYQDHWCEHNPSCTINVREDEWVEVGAWVYKHFAAITGVSFLPHAEHTYKQAPYQEITEETYNQWLTKMPSSLNWDRLREFELQDSTSGSQTLSCSGGVCEIVDLVAV